MDMHAVARLANVSIAYRLPDDQLDPKLAKRAWEVIKAHAIPRIPKPEPWSLDASGSLG